MVGNARGSVTIDSDSFGGSGWLAVPDSIAKHRQQISWPSGDWIDMPQIEQYMSVIIAVVLNECAISVKTLKSDWQTNWQLWWTQQIFFLHFAKDRLGFFQPWKQTVVMNWRLQETTLHVLSRSNRCNDGGSQAKLHLIIHIVSRFINKATSPSQPSCVHNVCTRSVHSYNLTNLLPLRKQNNRNAKKLILTRYQIIADNYTTPSFSRAIPHTHA